MNGFARGRGGEKLCKGIRDLKKKKLSIESLEIMMEERKNYIHNFFFF